MTYTVTETRTFTIVNARKVAAKIATELDLLGAYYGRPSEQQATDFAAETALLLVDRYLKSVEYGFRRSGKTVLALRYIARSDGTLVSDDTPGRIYANADIDGADWYSYLEYSEAFWALPQREQARIKAMLPVQRITAPAPEVGNGYWEPTRTYSSNREGVLRHAFRPL
jgi:hypothetical protein